MYEERAVADDQNFLAQQVRAVVARQLRVDPQSLEPEVLLEELASDSLSLVELVLTLEASFRVRISDAAAARMRTVDDIVRCVERSAR